MEMPLVGGARGEPRPEGAEAAPRRDCCERARGPMARPASHRAQTAEAEPQAVCPLAVSA
jgi:hypothetical protein